MNKENENHSHLLLPPGGVMVWIFAFTELIVFACAAIAFLYQRGTEIELFASSRLQLNQALATLNTLILITSSYSVVKAVEAYDKKRKKQSLKYLYISLCLGISFLVVKFIEYNEKMDSNFVLGTNTFFDYYWMLTAFHALHVVIGIGVLALLAFYVQRDKEFVEQDFNFHTGANYWHLCDLVWIIIFPLLYLL